MEALNGLSNGRKLLLAAGLLLILDTFLDWQKVSVSIGGASISAGQTAWHGFFGVLLSIMTIAVVLWVAARALGVALPANLPDGLVTLALGGLILLFAVIKNLNDDYSAWPSYVGIVLAAGVAVGAWMAFQETGEELPSFATSHAAPAAAAPAAPAAPAAEDAPDAPAGVDPV